MYLIHVTTVQNLIKILIDMTLKSNQITGKINQGEGIYKTTNFVYFSTCDELFDPRLADAGQVIIYLKSDFLLNRSFYVSTVHTDHPNVLDEWNGYNYKRKYSRYETNYNKILRTLYKRSLKQSDGKYFEIFQQVAILNKVNITNFIIGIKFNVRPDTGLLKKLDKLNIRYELNIK